MTDTKDRILDAAEALFADRGLSETSMRAITRAAAVNLAAVNYHFGSKDALIQAVFARRAEALNSRRLEALAGSRARGELDLEAVLDAYIRPALEMARDEKAARYIRLLGRAYTDPNSRAGQFLPRQYDATLEAFKPEFSCQLPQIDKTELYWRLHFLIGSLVYCMAGLDMMQETRTSHHPSTADADPLAVTVRTPSGRLDVGLATSAPSSSPCAPSQRCFNALVTKDGEKSELSSSCYLCDPADIEGMIRRLVAFVAAGMRAEAASAAQPPTQPAVTG